MGRGANWTSQDDVKMCKSWLHISGDSKVGNNQKFASFWMKIMAHMKAKMAAGDAERTIRAAQSRWAIINAAVAKFVSAHAKAQRSAPSGTNLVDLERRAMEIYRVEFAAGKSFEFKECWYILKSSPKWNSPPTLVTGHQGVSSAPASSESMGMPEMGSPSVAHSASPVASRPVGSKRAKADFSNAITNNRALKAVESANALASKRQRILEDQVALGYFKLQDERVAPELRELFLRRRAKLLKELEEDILPADSVPNAQSPLGHDEEMQDDPSVGTEAQDQTHAGDDDELHVYGPEDPLHQMGIRSFRGLLDDDDLPLDSSSEDFNRLEERDLTLGFEHGPGL